MFGQLGFSGINIVHDLTQVIDVALCVERVSRDLKRNAVLARDFLCKNRNACGKRRNGVYFN